MSTPPTPSSQPAQPTSDADSDLVFVRGLRVQAIIGIHVHERITAQTIVLDIEATTNARLVARHDDIARDVVNYSRIREIARETAIDGRFQLVESLAERIAERLCRELNAARVRVCVGKPDAYDDAALVGVIVTRRLSDYR